MEDIEYSDHEDSPSKQEEEEEEPQIQRKPYRGNFETIKEETNACPYSSCGRKFVSPEQLKLHIERRHAAS